MAMGGSMTVKVEGKQVDVSAESCPSKKCFYLFADKGTFAPGKGYTSYHKQIWCVCGTRHLHGCPSTWQDARTLEKEREKERSKVKR
jgi:hypothetical protein